MQSYLLALFIVIPGVRYKLLDLSVGYQILLFNVCKVAAQDRAARHEKGFGVLGPGLREIAVGHEIANSLPVALLKPILVKRGDGERVGHIHLVDKASKLLNPGPYFL